jgi:hypothetical protein
MSSTGRDPGASRRRPRATLGDVVVRVASAFALDLHLDTDEANAAGLGDASVVAFAGVERRAASVTSDARR